MKSIYIKSGKIKDVFNDLKNTFNGSLTSFDRDYNIALQSDIASGNIEGTVFDKDMTHIHFDVVFQDDIRISLESSVDSPIFFTYCLDGFIQHSFGEQGHRKCIKKQESGILKSNSSINSILYFRKNIPIKFSIIRISLNSSDNLVNDELLKKIEKTFIETKENSLEVRPQNSKIIEQIYELNNINQKGIVRKLLKNKILEIILEIEIQQHTDNLVRIAQEINSSALKGFDEIKKVSNSIINYSVNELFTIKAMKHTSELFISKFQVGLKIMNI